MDGKAELWNNFFFSKVNEEKNMPNILGDVLPGKVVQPVHIANCTRGICASHISMEGAGWQSLASCLGPGFFFQEGQRLSFQPSGTETAAGCGHVTAFGQWNISGGVTLCHARLGRGIFPILGNHGGRATDGRCLGSCIISLRRAAHLSGTPTLT